MCDWLREEKELSQMKILILIYMINSNYCYISKVILLNSVLLTVFNLDTWYLARVRLGFFITTYTTDKSILICHAHKCVGLDESPLINIKCHLRVIFGEVTNMIILDF
jgi:hypothetical protein